MPNNGHIRVKVRAGERKESFVEKATHFEITVKEPAQENQANDRVRALIARHFKIPVSKVRFVSGQRSPNKRLEIIR
jgi:uncharacterized protein YggU (UPF0235/DUF167 family)